ncbi:amino acid adenylation domain-containing protein [Streptomyces sp. NPDC002669]|uniref:amino acid adenylation domain-containing protein n=1 Tax=Streptomyces sp. NPDC002669 TaxID=3364658 RepID=UPI00369DD93E
MGKRVDAWVEETIASFPESVAIQDAERTVTYAELGAVADRVRERIAAGGIRAGSLVAIRMRRGWRMYAAMLGIWKHGCGYVPIDPAYPEERQEYILRDAGVRLLVEDGDGDDAYGDAFLLRECAPPDAAGVEVPPGTAYVIHTSGSTGRPKGVVLGHPSVRAFLEGFVDRFGFGPEEVWAQFTSPCFDVSVAESWTPLVTGARLLVVPEEATVDPRRLVRLLAEGRATVLSHVPTVFRYLLRATERAGVTFPAVRHVLLAGEPVEPRTVSRWIERDITPGAEFHNLYGPTEGTVYATCQHLTPEVLSPTGRPGTAIGTAMPHVRVELLRDGRPVPRGVPGEICLGGAVALGYLGRPEQTAAAFVRRPGEPVRYRTGDLAVQDEDGTLRFLGRDDEQVKLRGNRIELGEIEARLNACAGVGEAAAVVLPSRQGDPMIVGCFVPSEPDTAPTAPRLRAELAAFLPSYMVPARIVEVDRMPLTLSGKLDRRSLEKAVRSHRTGIVRMSDGGAA